MSHKQVFALVKTLVDSGIKDVIEALNRIPEVWTISSCEGGIGEFAEIAIIVGRPFGQVVSYVHTAKIANHLFALVQNYDVEIVVEWAANSRCNPKIMLRFEKGEATKIANALTQFGNDSGKRDILTASFAQ